MHLKSGIYAIVHIVSGKRYYGSSVNMDGRKRQHWSDLRLRRHKNPHLQAAWNKYGDNAFEFRVIERLPKEQLEASEQRYLDGNENGYNIGKFAYAPARGRKKTAETIAKMSAARKGKKLSAEHKAILSLRGRGRKHSQEARAKMSAAQVGKRHSDTTKLKLAEIGRKKWSNRQYRDRMKNAQARGKATDKARKNSSAAMAARWADIEQRKKLSSERKARWADPEFRAKMLAIRREQGKRYSGENWRDRPKKKEQQNARA